MMIKEPFWNLEILCGVDDEYFVVRGEDRYVLDIGNVATIFPGDGTCTILIEKGDQSLVEITGKQKNG